MREGYHPVKDASKTIEINRERVRLAKGLQMSLVGSKIKLELGENSIGNFSISASIGYSRINAEYPIYDTEGDEFKDFSASSKRSHAVGQLARLAEVLRKDEYVAIELKPKKVKSEIRGESEIEMRVEFT